MTSKEAINKLNVLSSYDTSYEKRLEYKECIYAILKDLEVLEILKRKSVDIHLVKDIMKDDRKFECYPDENLTQEEFNKIKEWLLNDK